MCTNPVDLNLLQLKQNVELQPPVPPWAENGPSQPAGFQCVCCYCVACRTQTAPITRETVVLTCRLTQVSLLAGRLLASVPHTGVLDLHPFRPTQSDCTLSRRSTWCTDS